MTVKQISVFLDDRSGGLQKLTDTLGTAGISIRAITLNDNPNYGILRVIVEDHERAKTLLNQVGFQVQESEVLAVLIEDRPGSLARVAQALAYADIEVIYMYATFARSLDSAIIILRTSNQEQAAAALRRAGIEIVGLSAF